MRVFIGLTEVAGVFGNLAKGFREIGIETTVADLFTHPFQYTESVQGRDRLVDLHRSFLERRTAAEARGSWIGLWWAYLQKSFVLMILLRAVVTCDTFIFSSNTTFFRYWDLPILRLLRKRIVFVFTGSDHRAPYLYGGSFESLDDESLDRCADEARQIKERLRRIEAHAHFIVGHHLSAHLHERPIVPFPLLGFPSWTEDDLPAVVERTGEGAVRIVHAPSRPRQKGTVEIRHAIDVLRAKGHAIDFIELVDVPNQVVLEELARCDFVVDELYSDARMAGLATEAASLGKPSVVGGYACDDLLAIDGIYPPADFPPVQFCHPDRIEEAIEQLISDVPYRLELGRRARAFVSAKWDPAAVAGRYVRMLEGRFPPASLFDPRQVRYLAGTGMPESLARSGIRCLIERSGVDALCLSDKPSMEAAFVAFSKGEDA